MEVAVAGAAVGATIKVAVESLLSFPVKEIGLLWNFKKDLQKMKKSMALILKFLEDAEMKPVTDEPVKRWLQKLDALAFDADYVFDQLNYQLLRKKVKKDKKKKKLQVSFSFSTSVPLLFSHKMAKEIKNINKLLKSINEEASELGLQTRIAVAPARGAGTEALAFLETDSLSEDSGFVGRDNEVTKIVDLLTSSPTDQQELSVFPIVGMGGIGKTTLARKVHNDPKIISHFGDIRIWVHVSENFDPVIVLKKTLESLTKEKVDASRDVVVRKLQEKIGGKRYLLVLDNVWNEDTVKWDNFVNSLKGISHVKGNVILVTTRSGNVGSISKTLDTHEIEGLSEDDCWLIIKTKAFGGEGPSEFETIGKNIAEKCGGLPLAAQVVGSLLHCKSKDEWVSIEKNWLSNFGGDENTVSKILKFSYDNLPSQSLKKCFAFCSIIPKGWWIEPDDLIALWMAEGFLQTRQEEDMEIAGKRVVNLLVQSSLLHVAERDGNGNILSCDMHDLVHDLARSVLNPKFQENNYQVRYISERSKDESSPITEEQAKCLRALFLSCKLSHIILSNLKCLHVLILNNEDVKELPIEIGRLISLRYIDISFTRIECLPDSFGDLYHLQTLMAASSLKRLPDTFKYLISLRHLYIPNIKLPRGIGKLVSLRSLPYFQVGNEEGFRIKELGSLKNLRGQIEIDNLEKVGDKEEAESADLFHKPNILKLKLVWNIESEEGESNNENVLEGLQPHPNLQSLEIHGFKSRSFPLWTMRMEVREDLESRWVTLENLMEIKLSGCEECEEIPMLGHLPHLKWLYLHGLSNVKSMGSSFYGIEENAAYNEKAVVFPALEKLELIGMPNLIAWDEVEFPSSSESQPGQVSVFGHLEYLKIANCRQLKSGPSDFPCLKELEIDDMESALPLANICGASKLTSLTKLRIGRVDGLVSLTDGLFYNNRDLLKLKIENCNNLTHLVPCLGGGGASLRKLEIKKCLNLKELPGDLHILNALEELEISFCRNLKSIAYYPSGGGGQLSSQGGFTSLRRLDFSCCISVTNLPIQMIESCTLSLETLWLTGAESITNLPHVMSILPKMPHLITLDIRKVPKFSEVAAEIGSLGSLQYLGIGGSSDYRDYVSFKASLDLIFPTLQSLSSLSLCGMEQWDALPDQLQHLTTLHCLYLHEFGIEALPEWLGNLSSLNLLGLYNCEKMRRFPSKKAMQGLTKLNEIVIFKCPLLKQNLEKDSAAASDDSEWSKISHIPTIEVDEQPLSAPSQ